MEPAPEDDPGALRGWRAIAEHLGKGVRTVQRWESLYGLPVHREGDAVFARRDELERWVRSWARYGSLPADAPGDAAQPPAAARPADTPPATPAEPEDPNPNRAAAGARPARGVRIAVAICVAAVLGVFAFTLLAKEQRQPGSWRVARRLLIVDDVAGRRLFTRDLGTDIILPARTLPEHRQFVTFADLDGDGKLEVLVKVVDWLRKEGTLVCLESDGELRFAVRPSGTRHFGSTEFTGGWLPNSTNLAVRGDGSRVLWVNWNHIPWFPNRLQQIGPAGEVLAEFWSDGHQMGVREARLEGRDVVLAWGTKNELRGGGLAVFDRGRVGGAAPAMVPEYRCTDCDEGGPREFLVFPPSCLWRRLRATAAVCDAAVDGAGRLRVTVEAGMDDVPQDGSPIAYAHVSYEFGPGLKLERVRAGDDFVALHAHRERQGLLDHPLGDVDGGQLLPVLRWDGSRFAPLPGVPIEFGGPPAGGPCGQP